MVENDISIGHIILLFTSMTTKCSRLLDPAYDKEVTGPCFYCGKTSIIIIVLFLFVSSTLADLSRSFRI